MFSFFHRHAPIQVTHSAQECAAAHAKLLRKVLAIYAQIKDPQQQVMFAAGMLPPHGPYPFTDSHQFQGVQLRELPGMTAERFNTVEESGYYDPDTGTMGGQPLGPNALPVGDFLKLAVQAQALHAD
ncbi:MAG: hypothetical protein ACRENK_15520 [Gemmatimonadaceae bacterium]